MTTHPNRAVAARARLATATASAAAILALLLASCGGGDPTTSDPTAAATPTTAEATPAMESTPAASDAAATTAHAASLEWPEGTEQFTVDLCASQGPSTIQGAGNAPDWQLYFDANLLNTGDTGTLQVSRASDKVIEYDADILTLTVQPDGTYDATGADAGGATFRLTGTCGISW